MKTPKIKLRPVLEGWTVQFTIGVQTFTLDIIQPRTKEEAKWYQRQLQTAFDLLKSETIKR